MNKHGHPQTLVARHPGNRNAQKAGVYSKRALAARAEDLKREIGELSPQDLRRAVLGDEIRSLLALRDALDDAIAEDGVRNRRGQPRAVVDQRLRVTDKLLLLSAKLCDYSDIREEGTDTADPPVSDEASLCLLIAKAHHERLISDIAPADVSGDLYLRAVIVTTDSSVLMKHRTLARKLLTQREKNRPWGCACFATRSARDDLELQDWIEEAREVGLRPVRYDARLAAIVRKVAAGERPQDIYRFRLRCDAINYVLLEQAERVNDDSRRRRVTQEDDEAVAPFWKALLSEETAMEDRLSAFRALDELEALGTCRCGAPERVLEEREFDQKCAYALRLLPLRNYRAAFLRVQLPETFLALQAAIDERALGWSGDFEA